MIQHATRTSFAFLCLLACLLLWQLPQAQALARTTPQVQEIISGNGIKTWLIEEHTLPIVAIKLTFGKAGSAYELPQKNGTAYMLTQLLKEGGGAYPGTLFTKQLEDYAITFDLDMDKDNFYINIKTLSENSDKALELLNIMLTQADLNPDAIKRVRQRTYATIAKKEEDHVYLASLTWNRLAFAGHPYALPKMGSRKTVETITREDLVEFMHRHFNRRNLHISVAGDVTEKDWQRMVNRHLTSLPEGETAIPAVPEITTIPAIPITHIPLDTSQNALIFGQKAINYNHPDFYAAYVLNYMLGGGGFESQLMQNLREKQGLVYSAYTYINLYKSGAVLQGFTATGSANIPNALKTIRNTFSTLKKEGVQQYALDMAKQYLTGSFFLRMDGNGELADFLDFMQIHDLGRDFLEQRNSLIAAVTLKDINRVAKELLDPDGLIIVNVGRE